MQVKRSNVATDALTTKNHQYNAQKEEKFSLMRSHSQTRLIDIHSLPQFDSWLCQIGRFSASTLSSTLALASQWPILPVFIPPQNRFDLLLSKIFIFCARGDVFQPTSLLPRASCHLQSSGTTCLRRYEIQ